MHALVIGIGSIGKRHCDLISGKGIDLLTIDPKKLQEINQVNEKRHFSNLESFERFLNEYEITISSDSFVVISNWGPDHFATFKKCLKLGYQKFLIEKPLFTSLRSLEETTKFISKDVQIWCNFHLRYNDALNNLISFSIQQKFGSLRAMYVTGGAKCLATTGVHWIDFFCQIEKIRKYKVSANIESNNINPRSKVLSFLEGNIFIRSDKNSIFSMTFSNSTHSESRIELLWENHKAIIENGAIIVYKNTKDWNLSITRTSFFDEVIFDEKLSENGMQLLYNDFLSANQSMENVTLANEVLLKSLFYSSKVRPPIVRRKSKSIDWSIS